MDNYFLYQLSKFILNEEESGRAITPDQFSQLLRVSSLELARQMFKGYEEGQEITDILKRFKSNSTISFTGGVAPLPADYFRRSALVANEAWVDFCSDYEFNIRRSGEVNFERYEKLVGTFFDEIVQGKEVATEESETPRESDKLQGKAVRKSVSPQERDMINFLRKFKKSLTLSLTTGEVDYVAITTVTNIQPDTVTWESDIFTVPTGVTEFSFDDDNATWVFKYQDGEWVLYEWIEY